MKDPRLANVTAGEILAEDYLKPLGISQYGLAKALRVPQTRISQIIRGKRKITPDTAMRLAAFFKTTAGFWLNIQAECDARAAEDLKLAISREVKPYTELLRKRKAA
jgi:antitoxin HigA-1